MLVELAVRNLAVIEETRLAFGPGLNVITGETGAGKSLLVDALAFALGGPADKGMMRSGAASMSVEAVFDARGAPFARERLAELGVETDGDDGVVALYRETHREGRAVSRLNGRAAPASVLRSAGAALVDIHGQGESLSLLDPRFQLRALDAFAGLAERRAAVESAVAEARRKRREAADAESAAQEAERRRDLLEFQANEIEAAAPTEGEEDALIRERDLLRNAEAVREACEAAWLALSEGEANAAGLAGEAVRRLRHAPGAGDLLRVPADAVESAAAQIADAAREIRAVAESAEPDPARLAEIEERVETLRRLKRKYGGDEAAVVAFGDDARRRLESIESADARRAALDQALRSALREAGALAWELSQARSAAADALREAVAVELREVGMERAEIAVLVEQEEDEDGLPVPDGRTLAPQHGGVDRVTFTARTNPGEAARPLAKIASGGETSRMMLALNGALRAASGAASLVFDEVDAGIGARAGEAVGRKLWTVGRSAQTLCVTHLPQIAAWADAHYRVGKAVRGGRAYSGAEALGEEERVAEIAGMLGGGARLEQAAREMLAAAARGKRTSIESPAAPGALTLFP